MTNQRQIEWFCKGAQFWNAVPDKGRIDLSRTNLGREVWNRTKNAASGPQEVSLEGIYLGDANLREANLSGLQLVKADMFGAQGQGAVFRGTNLDGAELDAGDFSGAMFQSASLRQKASLDTGKFVGASFHSAKMQGAFCYGSDFTDASFARSSLQGANFRGATLQNSDFTGANLRGACLSQADLSGAKLISTQVVNTDLRGANLSGIVAPDTQLWKATLYADECEPLDGPTVSRTSIESVAQLLEVCRELAEYNQKATGQLGAAQTRTLYFRGHDVSHWELTPSVTRSPSPGRSTFVAKRVKC